MSVMVNSIALVEQEDLMLPFISIVAACLLAIGGLLCIRAMPIVRRGVHLEPSTETPMSCDHTRGIERTSESIVDLRTTE